MLNCNSIMIGSSNEKTLAEFYEKVFEKKPDMSENDWYGFSVGSCFIGIGTHDKVNGVSKEPARIMINFETTDVKAEFARIQELGATVVAQPYEIGGAWIATFADPDGNYFQLMTPWNG